MPYVISKSGLNESNLDQIKCTACDDKSVADWSCKECNEKLCDLCYKAQKQVKLTQNHAFSKL